MADDSQKVQTIHIHQAPSNGLGVAGFTFSLVGLLLTCGLLSPIGLILSLCGLAKPPRGLAIAGTIIGGLGSTWLALFGLAMILPFIGLSAVTALSQFEGVVKADIIEISTGVDNFVVLNNGRHPESLEQLVTPDFNGETILKGRKIPTDPWGNEFQYDPPMSGTRGYRIYTLGKDNALGGEGEDMDIDNWMIEDGHY